LAVLSYSLRGSGRKLLLELLVPATPAQLEAFRGDPAAYDRDLRPLRVAEAIEDLQSAGVEPDMWKIEGLDRREDYRRIAAEARSDGRDRVSCIVIGRGADDERIMDWLVTAAGLPGYTGCAIGRTLWWNELHAYTEGRLARELAVRCIAGNFARMLDAYALARVPARLAA
jgi:myo-inositol catabolism protein IolC